VKGENMYPYIFAAYADLKNEYDLLKSFVLSIRDFCGEFSSMPIVIVMNEIYRDTLTSEQTDFINSCQVQIEWITIPEKFAHIPYHEKTLAAGFVENGYLKFCNRLIWADIDTLFLQFPQELTMLNLPLACRPVDLKNIAGLYEEPLPAFWNEIYNCCSVSTDNLFDVVTTIDQQKIYSYFNAGCIVVSPEYRILSLWKDYFEEYVLNVEWQKYFEEDNLYKIFIHQVFLNIAITSLFTREDIHILDYHVNYPLCNQYRYPEPFKVKDFDELVSVRLDFYLKYGDFSEFHISESKKSWLKAHVYSEIE